MSTTKMKAWVERCPCQNAGCDSYLVAPMFRQVEASLPKDEADRIAACINYCYGMPTSLIEKVLKRRSKA